MTITLDQTLPIVSQPKGTGVKTVNGVSAAANGANTLGEQYDSFLLLLTTQLKNQDPTSPMETNEFTQQLVSFTGVEQQILTNQYMEKIIGMNEANQTSTAVSFIGKQVQAKSDRLELKDGKGPFSFEITAPASSVEVVITNASGGIIHSNTLRNVPSGRNELIWDGTTDYGLKAKDGAYKVNVIAKDVLGNPLSSKTYTSGTVSAVSMITGQPTLTVNGQNIPLTDVISVVEPKPTQTASN